MNKVWMVGYDFSEHSLEVAQQAASELSAIGGKLMLLHVFQVPPTLLSFNGGHLETSYEHQGELSESLQNEASKSLEVVLGRLRPEFPQLEFGFRVKSGDPSDVLLEEAESLKVDRIVVGSHSRTGIEHFFLGSVAEKVVKHSSVTVLVIKHCDSK